MQGAWKFIDQTGQTLPSGPWTEVRDFHDGLAAVQGGGLWGFIDRNGVQVIAPRFEVVTDFQHGLAAAGKPKEMRFIDRTGEVRIPGPFLQATAHTLGLAHVQTAYKEWAWIDASGRVIFSYQFNADF